MMTIFNQKAIWILGLLFLFVTACGDLYSEQELTEFDQEIQKFIQEKGWSTERTETGLYIEVLEFGENQPVSIPFDAKILVTYKGYLLNGKTFDQTSSEPVLLNARTLIEGWREALLYLNVGSSARVIIPPNLGYKNQELPDIPKNSILVFEFKIHDIE